MESFLGFVESLPDWHGLAVLLICLIVFTLIESAAPLFSAGYPRFKHAGINLGLLAINTLVVAPLSVVLVILALWVDANAFGVLQWVSLPVWAELLIAIMMLDLFAQYGVHYLLHHVKWMWRMHMVHHSDTHVDATTAIRHHPGDAGMRIIAAMVAVLIFGIPVVYYLIYRSITAVFGTLTHANFALPKSLDRALSYVFVTPDVHKFHHHLEAPWTDSNFGNVFSIWDRVFGTLVYDDVQKIEYGLDVADASRELDMIYQLKVPFDTSISTEGRPGLLH